MKLIKAIGSIFMAVWAFTYFFFYFLTQIIIFPFLSILGLFGCRRKSTYIHPTLEEMQQLEVERRKKDKVDELLSKNGFHDRIHGRDGYIYYVEDGRLCEISYEYGGKGFAFGYMDLREWIKPEGVKINKEHQLIILRNLRLWLKEQKKRSDIDLPKIELTDRRCAWKECDQRKIKGSAYCPLHYDINMLRE